MQEWIVHEGLRLCVLFEGRDTAGKGGTIKRIMERLNARYARVVALGTPSEREKSQWYFQRYVPICPQLVRSCCSIGAGTTGRRRARHGFLYPQRIRRIPAHVPADRASLGPLGPSCSSSTGCRSVTRNRNGASSSVSTTRANAGS